MATISITLKRIIQTELSLKIIAIRTVFRVEYVSSLQV